MIKVNLIGEGRKKAVKTGAKFAVPASTMPVLLVLIVLGSVASGYWWYLAVSAELEDVTSKTAQAETQRQQLEAVIKQDEIYEARKKALENRLKVISSLQRNQVSPVVSLDILGEAIDRTQYVWLSNLDQNNAVFRLTGTGTSLNAIADFVTNLENTRYFRTVDLVNAQDAQGNFTFSLTCEFSPPSAPADQPAKTSSSGGN